ncbi:restriction endonuclease subunit S [Algoriphagus sediminis]|uniref:Restriction endonuclease subunit S n=1 Tax=Algoriphagus sediminis TaxID=3057113 RepID=A0ABT7YDG5_9BACT|nr:restriction endonuclease subunit S [Algoriphagus sediminis]MDN3204576.1 restriction endonuclease subunit S [Algoriphagus sediminis]
MKEGWEIKKLVELSNNKDAIVSGPFGSNLKVSDYKDVGVPIFRLQNVGKGKFINKDIKYISDEKAEELKYHSFKAGDLVLAKLGIPIGKTCVVPDEFSSGIIVADVVRLRLDKNVVDYKFLEYFLNSDEAVAQLTGNISGATRPRVNLSDVRNIEISLPPLPEQQRIVSILDQAFTAIDKGKANAEQNLQNAKELFESYLQGVFEKKGDGWEEQLLRNSFKLKSGDNLTAKKMVEGDFPVFGGNGIAGYHIEFNLSGTNVIVGRVGALCGNVRHINENIWLTDNAFKIVDFKYDFDHSFLTYLLNYKDLRSYARQAAQPVISNSSLQDVVLNFPKSKEEQQTIVRQLNALRAETQKLEAVYQKKMDDLEELKKSILQKAFAGELTGKEVKI